MQNSIYNAKWIDTNGAIRYGTYKTLQRAMYWARRNAAAGIDPDWAEINVRNESRGPVLEVWKYDRSRGWYQI